MSESVVVISFGAGYVLAGLALLGVSLKLAEPKAKLIPISKSSKK
jgi:hypothetical protein